MTKTTQTFFSKMKERLQDTPSCEVAQTLALIHKSSHTKWGNLLDLHLMSKDVHHYLDPNTIQCINEWKSSKLKQRYQTYPTALADLFFLKKIQNLPWDESYLDPTTGNIKITKKDIGEHGIVKGKDTLKRPFIAFQDDEDKTCVIFQRYKKETYVDFPVWVQVEYPENFIWKISDDNFEKFTDYVYAKAKRLDCIKHLNIK